MPRWAAPENCPFDVNLKRFNQQSRGDHWEGGYYFEVLSSATPGHRFWDSDLRVVIDFGRREYKFTTTGCDEDVGHVIIGESPNSFTILADDCGTDGGGGGSRRGNGLNGRAQPQSARTKEEEGNLL